MRATIDFPGNLVNGQQASAGQAPYTRTITFLQLFAQGVIPVTDCQIQLQLNGVTQAQVFTLLAGQQSMTITLATPLIVAAGVNLGAIVAAHGNAQDVSAFLEYNVEFGATSGVSAGYSDLEKYVCLDVMNRPNLLGAIDRTAVERPWFRAHLPWALKKIQTPYHSRRSGRSQMLWDGSWRGMELKSDTTYGAADTDGIAYPSGYRNMRYVYLVDDSGNVAHHPIKSYSEEEYNTQTVAMRGEGPYSGDWPWFGVAEWDWIGWLNSAESGRVRWMDKNGKFYLTWTPSSTRNLRMVYFGYATGPTTTDYTNNNGDWFTENLFLELAMLVEALMWRAAGEDDNASRTLQLAEQLIGDAWRLNQGQKAGSNNRVYVPPFAPTARSRRGY